jgi:hypothetical protein
MKPMLKSLIFAVIAVFFLAGPGLFAADEKNEETKKAPPKELPKERRHPTYALTGLDDMVAPDNPLNPNFVISNESKIAEDSLWRSSYIPERLVGVDVGDVDNDGLNEMVYVTLRNVYLTRFSGGEYIQLATYSLAKSGRAISVDVYDTDGDAKREIIVSAENDSNHSASSLVLSYDGSKELKLLSGGIPYYLRVVGQEGSRLLIAQKSGSSPGELYSGPVYYASFSNGKIEVSNVFALPFQTNIYNFNVGDLGKDRMRLYATIKFPTEHLMLSDLSDGGKVWESHDEYGGTNNYLELFPYGDGGRKVEYLPSRIIIADIDKDGANEVIVAKNNMGGSRIFKNLRSFNSGTIEARKFVNLSLIPFFTSSTLLPGPAVDYQLADFDNNGSKDLVVAVVIEPGSGMLEEARSILFSYNNLYNVETAATPAGASSSQKK